MPVILTRLDNLESQWTEYQKLELDIEENFTIKLEQLKFRIRRASFTDKNAE